MIKNHEGEYLIVVGPQILTTSHKCYVLCWWTVINNSSCMGYCVSKKPAYEHVSLIGLVSSAAPPNSFKTKHSTEECCEAIPWRYRGLSWHGEHTHLWINTQRSGNYEKIQCLMTSVKPGTNLLWNGIQIRINLPQTVRRFSSDPPQCLGCERDEKWRQKMHERLRAKTQNAGSSPQDFALPIDRRVVKGAVIHIPCTTVAVLTVLYGATAERQPRRIHVHSWLSACWSCCSHRLLYVVRACVIFIAQL